MVSTPTHAQTRAEVAVESFITDFAASPLSGILGPDQDEWLVMKYVGAARARQYAAPAPLWISESPLQTWGTATYVAPVRTPLTSLMYGRVGLACPIDPSGWRVFDATQPAGVQAYIRWARSQPVFPTLVTTVHSTWANHVLRDTFRRQFHIECVLFRPDQDTQPYTDMANDVWLAVTDWTAAGTIATKASARLSKARLTVLIDEEFETMDTDGLPMQVTVGQLEPHLASLRAGAGGAPMRIATATPPTREIANAYAVGSFIHLYIEP